jgi:DNA-binding CsgD family transcriptional regulator
MKMRTEISNSVKGVDLPTWKRYWRDKGFLTEMEERDMIRRDPPDALNRVFHVGPFFACVVDYRDLSFQYITGLESVLGYDADDLYKKNLDYLAQLVHPEDVQKVLGLAVHYFAFLDQQPTEKRFDFWPSINFKMRKIDGQYLRVLEQVICLKADAEGRITHALKYFTDISHLNYSDEVVLAIIDTKDKSGQKFYTFKAKNASSYESGKWVKEEFSDREKEILSMIAGGITSKEIALRLGLSHHTVNKHRENMMRKTGCKNMNEVISFAYCSEYL